MSNISHSKEVAVGDVIQFYRPTPIKRKRFGYGLVIRKEEDRGFYYIKCNKYGEIEYSLNPNISPANYINHSNMLLGDVVMVIGNYTLSNSYGMPSCGIIPIDNYLSLLDGRYQTFKEHAPKDMHDLYAQWENENLHTECGFMVAEWYKGWLLKNSNLKQVGSSKR